MNTSLWNELWFYKIDWGWAHPSQNECVLFKESKDVYHIPHIINCASRLKVNRCIWRGKPIHYIDICYSLIKFQHTNIIIWFVLKILLKRLKILDEPLRWIILAQFLNYVLDLFYFDLFTWCVINIINIHWLKDFIIDSFSWCFSNTTDTHWLNLLVSYLYGVLKSVNTYCSIYYCFMMY